MPADWTEVADRCWVRRYGRYDVSCGVVAGDDGLLVVDTRSTLDEGRELVRDLRALSPLPVLVVVNTHAHFDHVLGNGALREAYPDVSLVGHETVPGAVRDEAVRDEAVRAGIEPVPPDTLFASVWATDLGDRYVEAVHLGRGHSAGDVVIRVPDADVVYAGDIVEESAAPSYGVDCWPLEWPQQLELLVTLLCDDTAVVPGHGAVVTKDFVLGQRVDLADVAGQIQSLHAGGVPVDEALARGSWPFPAAVLAHGAVPRGYAHLGG